MTAEPDRTDPPRLLRPAIVLGTTEDECTVLIDGRRVVVAYAPPFPTPRVDRVHPGHLVALASGGDGREVVVWRWFDAVVLDSATSEPAAPEPSAATVTLWEPAHGAVVATPRHPAHRYRPGGRAYLSAGLPGAEWWVAGPVVDRAEEARVELAEVEQFFTDLGLWADLL